MASLVQLSILRSFETRTIDAAVGQTSMDCALYPIKVVFNQHPPSSICSKFCYMFQNVFWSRKSPSGSVDRDMVLKSRGTRLPCFPICDDFKRANRTSHVDLLNFLISYHSIAPMIGLIAKTVRYLIITSPEVTRSDEATNQ